MVDAEPFRSQGVYLSENTGHARVVLFGSFACGDAREEADLDFLVSKPLVEDRLREQKLEHRVKE